MTDLQYKILDKIYNYKGLAKIKYNEEAKGLDIDAITKEDLIKNVWLIHKCKYEKTLNKLLCDGYIQKIKIVLDFEGYQLTDFGLKSYNIKKEEKAKIKKWHEKPIFIGIVSALVTAIVTALLSFLLMNQSTQLEYKKLNEKILYLNNRVDTLYLHPIANRKNK